MKNYTIQQAAKATGISIGALRYYEREGLLFGIERLPNGHRRYSKHDLGWIEFVLCLRGSGMPIQDIKQYVALSQQAGTGHSRCELLELHRDKLKANIATLMTQLEQIESKVTHYHEMLAQQDSKKPEVTE